jgi:hypothetical protein
MKAEMTQFNLVSRYDQGIGKVPMLKQLNTIPRRYTEVSSQLHAPVALTLFARDKLLAYPWNKRRMAVTFPVSFKGSRNARLEGSVLCVPVPIAVPLLS